MSVKSLRSEFKTALAMSCISAVLLGGTALHGVVNKEFNPMGLVFGGLFAVMGRAAYKDAMKDIAALPADDAPETPPKTKAPTNTPKA
ncbi:MAG: hypothetical protein ACK4NR_05150 [Micavibrio sp.]